MRDCSNCKHWDVSTDDYPCNQRKTINCPHWEPKQAEKFGLYRLDGTGFIHVGNVLVNKTVMIEVV